MGKKILKAKIIKLSTRKNQTNSGNGINKVPLKGKLISNNLLKPIVMATPLKAKPIIQDPVKVNIPAPIKKNISDDLGIVHDTNSTLIPQIKDVIPASLTETSAMFSMNPNAPRTVADTNAGKNAQYATQVISQKLIEATEGELKDQIDTYLEVCDSIMSSNWKIDDITDILFVLIRSLGYDKFLFGVVEHSSFGVIHSHGFTNSPSINVVEALDESIISNSNNINWQSFMKVIKATPTDLSEFLYDENIYSVGYIPIHANDEIYGFMMIASTEDNKTSSITSQILDLCGSRFGLSIKLNQTG